MIKKIKENKEAKTQCLLLLTLFLACLFIFRDYIFGNKIMVFFNEGSDTYEQYTMNYLGIVKRLSEGTFSSWDFTNGFGINLFNYNLFDPSLMLLYIIGVIGGNAVMLKALIWVQTLKVLVAGLVFYRLLSLYSYKRSTKFLIAFLYGFNGYLMLWGQHYFFGMSVIYLPLMFLFCEKFITNKKGKNLFPIMIFLCGIYSSYFTYMCMAATGFYLLFRIAMLENLKITERIKKFFFGCGEMLLGLGMSTCIFLPALNVILNTSGRVGGKQSFLQLLVENLHLFEGKFYISELMRLFSSNLENVYSLSDGKYEHYWNYYEDPVLFTSVLTVFLVIQFLLIYWKVEKSRRKKIVVYLLSLLIFLSLVLPIGGMAFNAFSAVSERFTFTVLPAFLIAAAWMLDYMQKGGKLNLFGVFLIFLLMSRLYRIGYQQTLLTEHKQAICAMAMAGEIITLCLVGFSFLKSETARKSLYVLLMLASIGNVLSDGYICYAARPTLRKEDTPIEQVAAQEELYIKEKNTTGEQATKAEMLKPQNFFREIADKDVENALSYLREIDPEFYRVEKDYYTLTSVLEAQYLGYRGISTYNSVLNKNIRAFLDRCYAKLYIYDLNHLSYFRNVEDDWFAAFTGVRYILSKDSHLFPDKYELLNQFGDIYVYRVKKKSEMVHFYEHAIAESSFQTLATKKFMPEILESVLITDDGENVQSMEEIEKRKTNAENVHIFIKDSKKDSKIEGSIETEKEGYLLFMVPYESGWELRLNGEKTEIFQGDLGFIACKVEPGTYEIDLDFRIPMLKEGVILAIICWLLWGSRFILLYRKRKKRRL